MEDNTMAKSIFEEMGGTYEMRDDYFIPCLTLPTEKEQPIGLFGQRHLRYLKEHHRITYTNLLTSGKLNAYLADIDRQAQECFWNAHRADETGTGVSRSSKAENALEWGWTNE